MHVENIYLLTKTVFDFDLHDGFTSMLIVKNKKMHNTYIKKEKTKGKQKAKKHLSNHSIDGFICCRGE
jgi:hypothetical protein